MRDLTSPILSVLARKQRWVAGEVSGELMQSIEAVCQAKALLVTGRWTQDYAWMVIKDTAKRPVACIWRRAPLAFVTSVTPGELRSMLTAWEAMLIEIDAWNAPAFSLDLQAIKQSGLWFEWHADPRAVLPSAMSLLDLQYATH